MIFDPDALLQLAAILAEKQGIPLPLNRETMCAIVDEAERLAGGHERDEPAALFFACALRAAAFGKIATLFLDDIAAAQAAAVGLKLDASELDLILLRGRIAFAAVGWESVRDDFARAMLTRFGNGPISTVSVLSAQECASAPRPPIWTRILCD